MFFFPNRNAGLDLVDDPTARVEAFAAVTGRHLDDDGGVTDGQRPDPVYGADGVETELVHRFGDHAAAFLDGEFVVGRIVQTRDAAAVIVIAHAPPKDDHGAALGSRGKRRQIFETIV